MKTISRRRMISGLGAGLAAAATPRIFAAQNVSKGDVMTTQKLEDPENRYPKPPFKEQQQPWPGLASKMDPRPDHGEKVTKARVVCLVAKRSSAAAIPEWAGAQRSPLREKALMSRSIIFQPSNRTPTK